MSTVEFKRDAADKLRFQLRLAILRELGATATSAVCLDTKMAVTEAPAPVVALGFPRIGSLAPAPEQDQNGTDPSQHRPLDAVEPSDQSVVTRLLRQARHHGFGSGRICYLDSDGEPEPFSVVDMSPEWGVYLLIRGGETSYQAEEADSSMGVAPRRLVHRRDAGARILSVDDATELLLGWEPSDLEGRAAVDFVHPDDVERALEAWLTMLSGAEPIPVRLRYQQADGSYRWFEVHNQNRLADPEHGDIQSELIDINEEMLALARVRDSELQFSALAESLPVGVLHLDSTGVVLFANRWMNRLTGLDKANMTDLRWVLPIDRIVLRQAIEETVQSEAGQELAVGVLGHDGETRTCYVQMRAMPQTDGGDHVIASVEDVTANLALESRLQTQACSDELTDLANRRGLRDWFHEEQSADGMVVFFIDLDGFKLVNEGVGHDAGDELLKAVAASIRSSVRPGDLVARLGGDEFVVGCTGVTTAEHAAQIAARLLDAVSSPVILNGNPTSPTCSIGVAMGTAEADIEELIGDADIATDQAKQAGGRRFQFFEQAQRQGVELQFQIANNLRHAIGTDQLQLHLQPIVDLMTGQRIGAEALVRWHHPELGPIPPVTFIPVAEQTRLMESLGAWILDEACRLGASMALALPSSRIAINVSPRQLAADGFLDVAAAAIDRYDLDPATVVFEVTETVFLEMEEKVLSTLDRVVEWGAKVALDDFGTGYSSLNHLRQMPAQVVKVDRSYTMDLGVDSRTTAIVDAMVGLTQRLGQEMVVEGIETAEQVELLRSMGVALGQGYHLGRPMPEAEFFSTCTSADIDPTGEADTPQLAGESTEVDLIE